MVRSLIGSAVGCPHSSPGHAGGGRVLGGLNTVWSKWIHSPEILFSGAFVCMLDEIF
jgi:hypothetical protein